MEPLSLGKIIEILTHRIEEYERRIIEKSDLTNLSTRQLYYLDEIFHLKQPTLTALAERIDVSKPSATAIVDKLERRGYIRKNRSEEDRRSFNIMLTEKGEKLAVLHDGIHYKFAEIIERFLPGKELQQLVKLLNKVIENT